MKKLLLLLLTTLILGGLIAAPLNESFSDTAFPPFGWAVYDLDGGDGWVRNASSTHYRTAPAGASIAWDSTAHNDWLVTPRLVPSADNYTLSFWASHYANYPETFRVWVSTTGNAVSDFTTELGSQVTTTTTWTQYSYNLSAYIGTPIYVAIQANSTDQYYLRVDDFTGPDLWVSPSPVLTVTPNPIAFGNAGVGIPKTVQVSLSNTGGANLIISSLALTNNTVFTIPNPPALPHTVTPGGPALTFNMVYTPTGTGNDTDVLTIGDNRATSTVNVTGTGIVGDICEAPYLATLPLVNYEGTTNGYANDYTAAMFTGLGSTNYVGGRDWVAKVTIPSDGWLDINLTNPSGDNAYYYPGIFLVNTIPTLANPATVLAQAYGSTAPLNITDAVVSAGDYYVIVDNWPSPAYINFVLNISFDPAPTGPVAAPNLDYPGDRQTGLPKTGFPFQFSWNTAGSQPQQYDLWIAKVSDLTITPYDSDEFFNVALEYPNVTSPYQPAYTYDYSETYVWTVLGSRGTDTPQFQWPPYEFTIAPDPTITLPHTQDFGTDATPVWPNGWTQTYSGALTSNRWTVSASIEAGGTANEMKCSWMDATGVSRLITPPINTNGIATFAANFNHYYNDYGIGVTAKLQYSHDLNTWYDTGYAIEGGSGSFGAYETVLISGLNAPITYLAWVIDGNHYQFNFWYVDDVYLAVPYNLDAKAVSIDMYQVVEPVAFTPMATVSNNGLQTISFNVTMTIGGTTLPAQSVTALAPGATQQLSFGSFTPVASSFYDVTVTTNLTGDQDPANNTISGSFVCLEMNKTAYADVAYDYTGTLGGPATFNLSNPGAITDLPAANPWPDQFLSAADWINGGWWGAEYFDGSLGGNWWQIDTATGAATDHGDVGLNLTGVAWNPVADVVYGTDGTKLYTVNKLTGMPTLVGTLTWDGTAFDGLFIDLAWNNNNGTLYGLDLGYDAVFTIDPVTLAITPLGYTTGYDLNYSQGMAFDQDSGYLYLAAYAGGGALLWVNTVQPDAEGLLGETYVIGAFQSNSEIDGFVIPYPQLAIPDLTIALVSGVPTLSWNSIVGATSYKVYASNDPYAADPWTLVATTSSTTYTYVGTEPYRFFKVTAVNASAPVRTQFSGLDRVRQAMQPTRVQSLRAKGPKAVEQGVFKPTK